MAHVVFVRPATVATTAPSAGSSVEPAAELDSASRRPPEYEVLLQRRAEWPEKKKECMWGIVGGA